MKTLISIFFAALIFSSCTMYDIEPRYDSRDRVVGYYEAEEYSQTYDDYTYYDFNISKSRYDGEIYLNNFYGLDISVYAMLHFDEITIPYQVVDGYAIEGVGTVYGNEIDLSYSVKDTYSYSHTDFCETKARFEY